MSVILQPKQAFFSLMAKHNDLSDISLFSRVKTTWSLVYSNSILFSCRI